MVEVYNDGFWGRICKGYTWNYAAAMATCKGLGYQYGLAYTVTQTGTPDIPNWLSNVRCYVGRTSLLACSIGVWDNYDCNHQYAAVQCYNDSGMYIHYL